MDLGLFQMPLHPAHRPLAETLEEDAEKIVYADELGFEEAWVGEHISCTTEPITSPLIFMASLLSRTKRIRFATGVVALPNHHPAIVAGEVALFDHLSRGRLIFGIGPGGLASDMELFGNSDASVRNERMAESIQTILQIWTQDPPYDIPGKHWPVSLKEAVIDELGVGTMAKPFQKPYPEIALSSMSPGSGSVKYAAQRGWRPVTANFAAESTVISHWEKYVEGCEAANRRPTGQDWSVARNILVAGSDAEAEDWLLDPNGSNYYYFSYLWEVLKRANYTAVLKPDPDMADEDVTVEAIIKASVLYGSSRTVAERIVDLRRRSGPFGTLLMASMDMSGANRERELASMRRLAEEVRPVVDKAGVTLAEA